MTYDQFNNLWLLVCAGPFWTIAGICAVIGIAFVVVSLVQRRN